MARKSFWTFLLLSIALPGIGAKCSRQPEHVMTGGECHWAQSPGIITIKEIARKPNPATEDTQSVTLTVEFTTDGKAANRLEEAVEVTAKEAEAKGVKKGKQYNAYTTHQTSGTCRPGPYLAAFSDWTEIPK